MRTEEIRPALMARIAAWGIAFLLTITLTVTAISGPAALNRVLTSEELHIRTATDAAVIQEQMEKVTAEIRKLAEDYSFSADAAAGALSEEEFREINIRAARWWTDIVSEGVMNEIPAWTANERIIEAVTETLDREKIPDDQEPDETVDGIVNDIEKAVNRSVMPYRKALVTLAVRYVSRKTDLPGLIRFVSQIPIITLALSILFTGIIALLCGKRIRWSLKYFGAACAGAGMSAAAGMIMIGRFDIGSMIRASSEGLNHQVQSMTKAIVIETWAATAVLFFFGIICLICYLRQPGKQRQNGGANETHTNRTPDPVLPDPGASEAGGCG